MPNENHKILISHFTICSIRNNNNNNKLFTSFGTNQPTFTFKMRTTFENVSIASPAFNTMTPVSLEGVNFTALATAFSLLAFAAVSTPSFTDKIDALPEVEMLSCAANYLSDHEDDEEAEEAEQSLDESDNEDFISKCNAQHSDSISSASNYCVDLSQNNATDKTVSSIIDVVHHSTQDQHPGLHTDLNDFGSITSLDLNHTSHVVNVDGEDLHKNSSALNTRNLPALYTESNISDTVNPKDLNIDSIGIDTDPNPHYHSDQILSCHPNAITDDQSPHKQKNPVFDRATITSFDSSGVPSHIDLNLSKKLPNSISTSPPDPLWQKQHGDPDNPKHMITGGIRLYDSLDPMNNGRVHTYADDPGNVNRSWEADTGQIVEKHDKKLHTDTKDDTGGGPR